MGKTVKKPKSENENFGKKSEDLESYYSKVMRSIKIQEEKRRLENLAKKQKDKK